MPNIGPLEIIIVLAIVLLIFGPRRLPELGRSLGSGMKNFKDSITGKDDDKPELAAESRAEAAPAARSDAGAPAPEPATRKSNS